MDVKIKIKSYLLLIIVMIFSLIPTVNLYCQESGYNLRYIKNEAFGFGEKLEYKVGMLSGLLTGLGGSGGIAVNKTPKKVQLSSGLVRECYDINFWVDSEGIVDITYSVHDRYRTIVDVAGIFPYEFYQKIREGSYKRDFKATFDQEKNIATVDKQQYKVDEYIQDVLSALFFVRTMDLSTKRNGEVIMLKNFYNDSTFMLPVKIIKREVVQVTAGKFNTILLQPIVNAGSLFKFKNTINVWVTDDDRKIPIKVATSIFIGEVGAELYRYSGVRGKVGAKIE